MAELDPQGVQIARRYARWAIGDGDWANRILDAYFHPTSTAEWLDEEEGNV